MRKETDVAGARTLFEDADAVAAPGESICACETADACADDDEIDGERGSSLCDHESEMGTAMGS